MLFNFDVVQLDYKDRLGNLDAKAHGVVKSNKNFPLFLIDGKEVVFKPLSKTKPLSTPFFAYSEVFWSTIINHYFDASAPIYKLAICSNYDNAFASKYHHGTIVDSLERPNCKLINLYQIFLKNTEDNIDIKNYINFCEQFYDYTKILDAKIMNDERQLGEQLAYQILLSILRLDQNYHYENPLFYESKGQIVSMTSPIDYEFSTMFMYLDNLKFNMEKYQFALSKLLLKREEHDLFEMLKYETFATIPKNIEKIVEKYPQVVRKFLLQLQVLINDLEQFGFKLEDNGYITPFNSSNYKIGHARFKKNDEVMALNLEDTLPQYKVDINSINGVIYEETLNTCKVLKKELEKRVK